MFDIGWSELLVVAIVAILVVGPKDLPRMLRTVGRMMGQVRRTANDFRRQFDDALREAEREVDLEETRKSLSSIGKIDPVGDIKKELKSATSEIEKPAAPDKGASGRNGAAEIRSYEPAEDDPVTTPKERSRAPKPAESPRAARSAKPAAGAAKPSKPSKPGKPRKSAARPAKTPDAAKPAKPAEKAGTGSGAA